MENRSGIYSPQPAGYTVFIPNPLPPNPPINLNDIELAKLLSEANREIGRLDGVAYILPNPDLFVYMYIRKEAVLSSQIEGTQASLIDILEFGEENIKSAPMDIKETVNYIRALDYGLERLESLPVSLRLIKEIHSILLKGTRGGKRNPGEFRKIQNWIGPQDSGLNSATFVPPPVPDMVKAMNDLELFIHNENALPILIKVGLVHCQFETIHPFLDGNGRIGRLLITFLLCQQKIINSPLLYLSFYFKKNRTEYYDWLMKVRNKGDWEGWLKFFLKGIIEVSKQATRTARDILELQMKYKEKVIQSINSPNALRLLDLLYLKPILTITEAANELDLSYPATSNLFERLISLGILKEKTARQRNKSFAFLDYLEILNDKI
ncbi:MAG: Uncharacterized protein XD78_1265 [Desulfotomaculum sp. 46_296]|nr:MAG: Uncharacterized protein XD78_1265 [Desulfotomaculum sp. 46_296]KUK98601.1 MAG: Uncharacterized protein XE09_0053 [Atribacteria bacterium 34_868]